MGNKHTIKYTYYKTAKIFIYSNIDKNLYTVKDFEEVNFNHYDININMMIDNNLFKLDLTNNRGEIINVLIIYYTGSKIAICKDGKYVSCEISNGINNTKIKYKNFLEYIQYMNIY